ncbi:uncharacterized protein LOC142238952 [Haematobia irritans]|uniref:uncharacterized protein LOC142238952 n=1 Tax=Haematobia irritans TaxID=7368 RepID=UPI003F5088B8
MDELKSLKLIGAAIAFSMIISGVCNITLIYQRVDRLMTTLKSNFQYDNVTVCGFYHYLILINISALMIFSIYKNRQRWIILWLIVHGLSFMIYFTFILIELNSYRFHVFGLVQAIRVASESILSIFCIVILFWRMRSVHKYQASLRAEGEHNENNIDLNEVTHVENDNQIVDEQL